MALNKYMHPRNIYKTPPDFAKLARSHDEFASIVKTEVTGKVTIDFKDPHSLRVLTKCLLKSDFGLDVVIPEDRLVPTLPLRLNYILWIEDLLQSVERHDNIRGLDIGTGACAIYPLLAAVKNKWYMIGTETDQESVLKALENVERNKLQEFVQVSKNLTKTLIGYLMTKENAPIYDFCMCNPPFYSNLQELCESRSPARLPPKNGFTGSPQELITEGGELTFCRKIIEESKMYKNKVLIFTTMVGHKINLKELEQDLKAERVKCTTTEFCQGRVTRWGLAWTYQEFNISKLVPGRDKARKKNVPVVNLLPELKDTPYNVETASKKLLSILQDLKIEFKILNKRGNNLSFNITATENTWSNQRRKKRQMKQLVETDAKKPKLNVSTGDIDKESSERNDMSPLKIGDSNPKQNNEDVVNNEVNDKVKVNSDTNIIDENSTTTTSKDINIDIIQVNENAETSSDIKHPSSSSNPSPEIEALVHALTKVFMKDNQVFLEMEFLKGTSGKEGLHQVVQYIKNHWKYFLFYLVESSVMF